MRARYVAVLLAALAACGGATVRGHHDVPGGGVAWRPLDAATLGDARAHHKLVLLSVQASWCHFCHVMNEETYTDARVLAALGADYVTVRVEADERPDVAERFREYGWPATVVLAPDATELVALRGYQEKARFASLLETLARELHGGTLRPRVAAPGAPTPVDGELDAIRARADAQLDATWDREQLGWGTPQKYPFGAPVRHAFARLDASQPWPGTHAAGYEAYPPGIDETLDAYARLLDPVWGGVYQYSVQGDWAHPHYEKIAAVQADMLRTFAGAYAYRHERRNLDRAVKIAQFVTAMLVAPDGAFYASMDADLRHEGEPPVLGERYYALDDAGRRALGIPRVDTSTYVDVNGDVITGLVALSNVAGHPGLLAAATRAWSRLPEELPLPHAMGRGAAVERAEPRYVRDSVQALRAGLALYAATGDAQYRGRALAIATAMVDAFASPSGALAARTRDAAATGVFAMPQTPFVENALAAEAFVRLGVLTADPAWRERAEAIVRALGAEETLRPQGRMVGEYLLALDALLVPRVHVTVVGDAVDARTQSLLAAANAVGSPRVVVERVDPGTTDYGSPRVPSAFLCTAARCSSPVTSPDRLAATLEEVVR